MKVGVRGPDRQGSRQLWLAVPAVLLSILAFAHSAGFVLAKTNPQLGMQVAPWNGVPYGVWAEVQAAMARSPSAGPAIKATALEALRREPLEFNAAEIAAAVMAHSGQEQSGRRIFRLVGRSTLRSPLAHTWLLSDAYVANDSVNTVREAEIVLRQQPAAAAQVDRLLVQLVDSNRAVDVLRQRLAADPPWRGRFMDDLGTMGQNRSREFALLNALRHGPTPLRANELRSFLANASGQVPPATLVAWWRALQVPPLPARERLLRNPDFEGSVAPQPFDWTFYAGDGSFGEIGPSPEGKGKALYIESTSRQPVFPAAQLLTLAPGRYRLTGQLMDLTQPGDGQVVMQIACYLGKNSQPLAQQPLAGRGSDPAPFALAFQVPATCPVQRLSVGAAPPEGGADVRAYLDDLSLTPAS